LENEGESMNSGKDDDLIAALGTTIGEAAIGIVRLSGSGTVELADRIFKPYRISENDGKYRSHQMRLGHIIDNQGKLIDEVMLCIMLAPRTYTRQDVAEIYCHGGVIAVQRVLNLVLSAGARLAEPGEFTKRAFLNGRIDLAQAEAVLEIIRARSDRGLSIALKQLDGSLSELLQGLRINLRMMLVQVEAEIDFPEDVEDLSQDDLLRKTRELLNLVDHLISKGKIGRVYREGLNTVLLGKPNTGKSTLLNSLVGEQRALVTDQPGTTRDLIEEVVMIKGLPVKLIDTAGIREDADFIELLGIDRARQAIENADLVVVLLDAGTGLTEDDLMVLRNISGRPGVILINKSDLTEPKIKAEDLLELAEGKPVLSISARLGWGLDDFKETLIELVGAHQVTQEPVMITRQRHLDTLCRVHASLANALLTMEGGWPADCLAVDLWEAWTNIGEILGEEVDEDIINSIFSDFCIGK
jgi:tRNA modification GTPase